MFFSKILYDIGLEYGNALLVVERTQLVLVPEG